MIIEENKQMAKVIATPNLPTVFHTILRSHDLFVQGEEILDTVYVERDNCEVVGGTIKKFTNWQPATLIIVTNFGITVLTEGGAKILDDFYGYSVRHTVFDKIASINLDICVLNGTLSILTTTNTEPSTVISFNTALYFREFENLVGEIRNLVFKASRH